MAARVDDRTWSLRDIAGHSTDTLAGLMLLGVAITCAIAALVSTAMLMLSPQTLQRRAEAGSRQRRQEGYRLDFFRPYLWMLATWPRRVVFSLMGLAAAGWLVWAYWPN